MTCANCDAPTTGRYCSNVCENMDRHPAPRDDMEALTGPTPTEVVIEAFQADPHLFDMAMYFAKTIGNRWTLARRLSQTWTGTIDTDLTIESIDWDEVAKVLSDKYEQRAETP